MKIVTIFANKLFAFHYENEKSDVYDRLLNQWNDAEYVYNFAENNKKYIEKLGLSTDEFIECIFNDVDVLEESLLRCQSQGLIMNMCFQPLHDQEYKPKLLSLQKKKCKFLRLYAIRINEDCFVITGGAIKITQAMQDHPDTTEEFRKLNTCRDYLKAQGVFDNESFYEIIN